MPPTGNTDIRLGAITGVALGRHSPGGAAPPAGQIYRARVARVEADGSCLLRVGGQTLRLAPGMDLAVGQELLLRVTAGSDGPRFTVLRSLPLSDDGTRTAQNTDPVVSALRVMASRQQPLAGLLAWLARPQSPALEAAVALLRNSLTSPRDLVQPERLKDAVRDAGLLLEPRLAAATAEPAVFPGAISGDFKLLLWRLLGQDGGALDDGLREMLEGLLAHISLRQLRAIRQAEDGHFCWTLELPLAWGERLLPIGITLRRERGLVTADRPEAQSWEVEFSLDAEPLGALTVHLYLRSQQISVALEAERPTAVAALGEELASLREALALQGFTVETVISRPSDDRSRGSAAREFSEVSALGSES